MNLPCRGAIACLACLLCVPANAHAQSDLLLPRQEINQVLAARRSRERQLNSLLDGYGRQLRIELCVVGKACELGPEGLAALDELEDELLRQARESFSQALEGQDANRRVVFSDKRRLVLMNDRVVAVSGTVSAEELRASQASVIEDVDAAVRESMPAPVAARLAAERKRLAEKGRQAQICSLVAAMDETLLLNDIQRDKLCRLIGSLWKDAWSSVAIRAAPPSPTPALKSSVVSRAKLRGLGGVFDLPDAALARLLQPAQRALWKQLREPFDRELTALQSRLDMARVRAQGLAGAAVIRRNNARRGFVMQNFGGVMRAVPIEAVGQGNRRVRFSAEEPKAAAKEIPAVKTACFELLLESLGETCSLPPETREKLQWAGKLDLHRAAARTATLQQKLQTQLQPAVQERTLRELVQVLTPDALLPESGSLLHKAIDSRLTAEQLQRWNEARRQRREFQRQADVQRQILLCSQRATLTVAQWDAFGQLLNDRLDSLPQEARRERSRDEVETVLAQAPDDALESLLGEAQWAAIRERLKELRQAHPPAER